MKSECESLFRQAPKARTHVLLIYRKMIPSIRLCGHCQMEWLADKGLLEYRAIQEMLLSTEDLNWADIVVLGRLDSWYEKKITNILKRTGRFLLYILDDDLLQIPPEVSSAKYYGQPDIQRNIREMIDLSDGILSPSPILLDKYAVNNHAAIQLEEPAIDPVSFTPHASDALVKIGFAGSIDRKGTLNDVLGQALRQIKKEFGAGVAFEFFGAIPDFAAEIGAKEIAYCDSYEAYRQRLNEAAWDIGLAPMESSDFHACKHYNKFSEYASAGIAGVYSNRLPYTRIQDPESVAVFCEDDPEDWYAALRYLIENRKELEKLRENCCLRAAGPLSIQLCAGELWTRILEVYNDDKLKIHVKRHLIDWKIINIFMRGISYLRQHGMKTPLTAMGKLVDVISGKN